MIKIRSYAPEDLGAVTAIYRTHVLKGTASFEEVPPDEAEIERRFEALRSENYPILIAEDEADLLCGYAYAGPYKTRSAYRFTVEDSIYVAETHLRRGIGHHLLDALIDACREGGFRQMMAVIGDSNNASSIGLHAAHGFTHLGTAREIGFKFNRWLDVVYMQKTLK